VPIYREYNARWLRMTPQALASLLVEELERSRAARRVDGYLVAA
jgi:hypothetical protein